MKPHRATLILVFGILGIVSCFPLGIAAWVMGKRDLKEMDADTMDPSGRGNTNAGRICGMIGTLLAGITIVIVGMILAGLLVVVKSRPAKLQTIERFEAPERTTAAATVPAVVDEAKFIMLEELEQLPQGILVVHDPKVVLATLTGKSERRSKYTWWYKTTVSAADTEVTIRQFGAFAWVNGKWQVMGSFTGKPYGAGEFAEWYACPNAVLKPGKSYSDPTNWGSWPELLAGRMRWYYVGVDTQGRRVKGEAVVELEPEIDPKKPKDPE